MGVLTLHVDSSIGAQCFVRETESLQGMVASFKTAKANKIVYIEPSTRKMRSNLIIIGLKF